MLRAAGSSAASSRGARVTCRPVAYPRLALSSPGAPKCRRLPRCGCPCAGGCAPVPLSGGYPCVGGRVAEVQIGWLCEGGPVRKGRTVRRRSPGWLHSQATGCSSALPPWPAHCPRAPTTTTTNTNTTCAGLAGRRPAQPRPRPVPPVGACCSYSGWSAAAAAATAGPPP